jgi:hypothetical protein
VLLPCSLVCSSRRKKFVSHVPAGHLKYKVTVFIRVIQATRRQLINDIHN